MEGNGHSWKNLGICLEELRETTETSVRIAELRTEI
jgi:hypothetical protein